MSWVLGREGRIGSPDASTKEQTGSWKNLDPPVGLQRKHEEGFGLLNRLDAAGGYGRA